MIPDEKKIHTFETAADFERWLSKHHASENELWIKIHKKGSGLKSITAAEAVDVVLCWGWIDGIRRGYDEQSFLQRYTPRRAKSIWSQVNREHVARLIAAGKMTPHGQKQVELAKADGRWDAAYAPIRAASHATLPADLLKAIHANAKAKALLAKLDKTNLFALGFRVGNMKTSEGRARKIRTLVEMLARGETITPMRAARPGPRSAAAGKARPKARK